MVDANTVGTELDENLDCRTQIPMTASMVGAIEDLAKKEGRSFPGQVRQLVKEAFEARRVNRGRKA